MMGQKDEKTVPRSGQSKGFSKKKASERGREARKRGTPVLTKADCLRKKPEGGLGEKITEEKSAKCGTGVKNPGGDFYTRGLVSAWAQGHRKHQQRAHPSKTRKNEHELPKTSLKLNL